MEGLIKRLIFCNTTQEIRICHLQAQGDGKDQWERCNADMQSVQQAWRKQLWEDNITQPLAESFIAEILSLPCT